MDIQSANPSRALKAWVVGAGVYNLATSALLAVPGLFTRVYTSVNRLNDALALGGGSAEPPQDGLTQLLVNTAGIVLCLLGALLIYASRDLPRRSGIPLFNVVGRVLFAGLVVYYVAAWNLPRIALGMALADLLIAAAFLVLLRPAGSWAAATTANESRAAS
jgi:hypothetical protein